MKTRNQLVLIFSILLGLTINGALLYAAGSRSIVEFEIEIAVDRVNNGVNLRCTEGCVWETLSFSCGPDKDCVSTIDEYGTPAE
jgi:hypothetical protein